MNILVTGAEGFLGRNLVELLSLDHYSVLSPPFAELDLSRGEDVRHYFDHHPIDLILHAATTLRNGTEYPQETCENNLRMFFNLLGYKSPTARMINFGSGSEFSRKYWHRKMREDFFGRHVPEDRHSFSKYCISRYILDARDRNLINLVLYGVYGKHEDYRYKFISNAIAKNLLGMPITINQNVVYDYIYMPDLYRIVKYFIHHEPAHGFYNVTPVASIDLVTVAETINRISPFQSEIRLLNPGIGVYYSGDNQRLLAEIGAFDFTGLTQSIQELYQYHQELVPQLDRQALEQDDFLAYAKRLKTEYFEAGKESPCATA